MVCEAIDSFCPPTEVRLDQLKEIILNLYSLMVQSYEYQGPATANAMSTEVYASNHILCDLHSTQTHELAAKP